MASASPTFGILRSNGNIISVEGRDPKHNMYDMHHNCSCYPYKACPKGMILATSYRERKGKPYYVVNPHDFKQFTIAHDRWCRNTGSSDRINSGTIITGPADIIDGMVASSNSLWEGIDKTVYPRDIHKAYALSVDKSKWSDEIKEIHSHTTCNIHNTLMSECGDECHIRLGYLFEKESVLTYINDLFTAHPGHKILQIIEQRVKGNTKYPFNNIGFSQGKSEYNPITGTSELPIETAMRETWEETGCSFSNTVIDSISDSFYDFDGMRMFLVDVTGFHPVGGITNEHNPMESRIEYTI